VDTGPNPIFGGHLEFERHFIFWKLDIFLWFVFHIKIYTIGIKYIHIKNILAYGMALALLYYEGLVSFLKYIFDHHFKMVINLAGVEWSKACL
jgi:hypothetical protein